VPLVDVTINGRSYSLTCEPGEESHLQMLAGHVDQKVSALLESVGQVGDTRLLLMAALLCTEEQLATTQRLEAQAQALIDLSRSNEELKQRLASAEQAAADVIDRATKRVEDIAARLAAA
jgi:cell division protein ZapA